MKSFKKHTQIFSAALLAATSSLVMSGCVSEYGFVGEELSLSNDAVPSPVPSVGPSSTPTPPVTPPPSPAPSPAPSVTSQAGFNEFNVPAVSSPKVDMLFVVDNSGSMAEEQSILQSSFSSFISGFIANGVDFHIGVITTDVSNDGNSSYWSSKLSGYVSPNMGCLLSKYSSYKFLTNQTPDLVNKFKANVRVGTSGSGSEQGLNSALQALSDSRLSGCNSGFLRDDALLSVIVVSDENEDIVGATGTSAQKVAARVSAFTSRLAQLKGPESRGHKVDYVINLNAAVQSFNYPLPSNTTNSYPEVYRAAALASSSTPANIATDFSSALVNIGSGIVSQAQSQFALSHIPLAGSLVVKFLPNQVIPVASAANGNNGYVYSANGNTIELKGSALQGSPGATLRVDYRY
jgi:hypothetical protein